MTTKNPPFSAEQLAAIEKISQEAAEAAVESAFALCVAAIEEASDDE